MEFGGGAALAAEGVTKNPDTRSGFDEAKYAVQLCGNKDAHMNLPTMRGLDMMMVMQVRGKIVHVGCNSTIDIK